MKLVRRNKVAPSRYERAVELGVNLARKIQEGIDADDLKDTRLERR